MTRNEMERLVKSINNANESAARKKEPASERTKRLLNFVDVK